MNNDRTAARLLKSLHARNCYFWEAQGKSRSVALFKRAAREVPAYRDFLKKARIDPARITTFEHFQMVPMVSKANYLSQYPLKDLAWGGTLNRPQVFATTSGSTGTPTYFPRSDMLDWQGSVFHQLFIQHRSGTVNGPVLVLVCFSMGAWIGGLLTYRGYEIAAKRGNYPISILTPGINRSAIMSALQKLAPQFAQTILIAYPPFLKDILSDAVEQGIDIRSLRLRFSSAAEAFTEGFRDYLTSASGSADPCLDTMSIYGSSDLGAMASETPLSIAIRRRAGADAGGQLFGSIFGSIARTPTLAQYNPMFINFESEAGRLILTGDNVIPLIRYDIGDNGGVLPYRDMAAHLAASGTSMNEMIDSSWPASARSELPFVFVHERSDSSTTLYGLQIYVENIQVALVSPPVARLLSGNFQMTTRFDEAQQQYIELNLEALPNVSIDAVDERQILDSVVSTLDRLNSEFRELHRALGARCWPRLVIWPAGDPRYFLPGVKRSWLAR